MTPPHGSPVPPRSLAVALDHVRQGGRLFVPTCTRCIVIDAKALARFERAGYDLLREDGDGYRMRQGRTTVYILPGQLKFAD